MDELTKDISNILESGVLSQKDGEKLRGRLQFANTQLFGRAMRRHMSILGAHIMSHSKTLAFLTRESLRALGDALVVNKPRQISKGLADHVHIYVDASFEAEGFCGVGGMCHDSVGNAVGFFSEQVTRETLELMGSKDKDTIIMELEALAMALALHVWKSELSKKRIVLFTDNESVRACTLKGSSESRVVESLLHHIFKAEEENGS